MAAATPVAGSAKGFLKGGTSVNLPLELSTSALGDWAEAVADWLAREHRASPTRWKGMLDDICAVFAASGQPLLSLEGRKILVDVNGKLLAATAKGRDGAPPVFVNTKSGRGRRGDGPPSPPPSLKRKFRFLSDAIELTEPTQRAFERAGLLRGYDPLDVLGALKGALGAKASDLQRQEALVWSFKVWNGGGGKPVEQALRAADLSVPTLGGWHRARTALFSGTWTSLGRTVEQYLLEAAPASPDCAKVRDRLLIGFGEWPRAGADDRRDDWFRFLRLLGTSDGCRRSPPPFGARAHRVPIGTVSSPPIVRRTASDRPGPLGSARHGSKTLTLTTSWAAKSGASPDRPNMHNYQPTRAPRCRTSSSPSCASMATSISGSR